MEKTPKKDNVFVRFFRKLDSISFGVGRERDYLLENVSMLIAGGMTVLAALDAVAEEVHTRGMKRILKQLRDDIESGSPLWKAFEKSGIFKDHTVSLIRVGEESGKLADNLKLIAIQEVKEKSFTSKIRSAMMYPVFVLALTLIIGFLIAWFILPRLATVFSQMKVELPTLTKGLITTGTFLGEHGDVFFPVFFLGLGLIIFIVFFFSKTKFIGQSLMFSAPGIKRLIQEVELSRFGYLLGTLLQAGIPVTQALDSLEKATTFPHYKRLYAYLRDSIADGNSFQKSFVGFKKINKLIPVPIQRLIVTGEQSGYLATTLLSVSANFEEKTEQTTKNISVILEPVLLVIVWLGVVAVALAVILPIYSLIGGFNTEPPQVESTPVDQSPASESVEQSPALPLESEIVVVEPILTLQILDSTIGYVNVRSGPSTEEEIISQAFPGEIYEYVNDSLEWYEIVLPDEETGWVFGKYVYVIDEQQ